MQLKIITDPAAEPLLLEAVKNHLKVDGAEDNVLIKALIKSARLTAENETGRAFITQTWRLYLDVAYPEIEIPRPPLQSIESIKALSLTESIVDSTSASAQAVLEIADTSGFTVSDTVIINRDGSREEDKIILSIQDEISLTLTTNLDHEHTADQADRVEKYTLVSKAKYNVDLSVRSPGRVRLRSGYSWPAHRGFASFIIEFKAGYGDAGTDLPEGLLQGMFILIGHMYENRGDEGAVKARIHAIEESKIYFNPYRILKI